MELGPDPEALDCDRCGVPLPSGVPNCAICGHRTPATFRTLAVDYDLVGRLRSEGVPLPEICRQAELRPLDLAFVLADEGGVDKIFNPQDLPLDTKIAARWTEETVRRTQALPWARGDDGRLLIATADPSLLPELPELVRLSGEDVEPILTSYTAIEAAIQQLYG